jgi:hypothetical protein
LNAALKEVVVVVLVGFGVMKMVVVLEGER